MSILWQRGSRTTKAGSSSIQRCWPANRIVVDPEVLAGKPVVAGTRIPVSLILNLLAHEYDIDRIRQAYPVLTEEDVRAAIAYAEARLDREEVRPLAE